MANRLSSPRFRRRALKVGVLLAVAAAAALVSIFFWDTATIVETPLRGAGGGVRAADPGEDGSGRAADRDPSELELQPVVGELRARRRFAFEWAVRQDDAERARVYRRLACLLR